MNRNRDGDYSEGTGDLIILQNTILVKYGGRENKYLLQPLITLGKEELLR